MSYIGRTGKLSQRAYNKVSFLATAGQTIKTGLSYVAGFVEVYLNGVLLTDTVDYTATNGNSVTFVLALNLDDEITIVSLKTFSVANMLPLSGGTVAGDLGVVGTVTVDGLVVDGDASINRLSTDGVLLDLKKDGATVGSIGTIYGYTKITSGDGANGSGMFFGAGKIYPVAADSVITDNAIDIGDPTLRFKDLYLSGGVVFDAAGGSGTPTGNKLDDYEEGTWTPRYVGSGVAGSSPTGVGTYTKVGRMVTVTANFGNFTASGATGNLHIDGLPFTASSASGNLHTGAAATSNLGADVLVSSVLVNEGYIRLRAANTSIYKSVINSASIYLLTTVTYETA